MFIMSYGPLTQSNITLTIATYTTLRIIWV